MGLIVCPTYLLPVANAGSCWVGHANIAIYSNEGRCSDDLIESIRNV